MDTSDVILQAQNYTPANNATNATLATIGNVNADTQAKQIANQQAQVTNPMAAQAQALGLQQQKLIIGAQLLSTVNSQASLDAAHANAQAAGLDTSSFPTTYDPATTPALAAQARNNFLSYSGKIDTMLKQLEIHNGAVNSVAGSTGQAVTSNGDALTLASPAPAGNTPAAIGPDAPNNDALLSNPAGPMDVSGSALPVDTMANTPRPSSPTGGPPMPSAAAIQTAQGGVPAQQSVQQNNAAVPSVVANMAAAPAKQIAGLSPQAAAMQAKLEAVSNDQSISLKGRETAAGIIEKTPEYKAVSNELDAQKAGNTAIATDAAKSYGEIAKAAADAPAIISNIQQLSADAQNFHMGQFAGASLEAGKTLAAMAHIVGVPTKGLDLQNASAEAFNKGAGQIVQAALSQTGETSHSALNAFAASLPHTTMTQNGFDLVKAGLIGTQQYNQIKLQAANAARASGTLPSFESDFQTQFSPMAATLNNMTPVNQHNFIDNLRAQPGGKAQAANLSQQIKWVRSQPWAKNIGINGAGQ